MSIYIKEKRVSISDLIKIILLVVFNVTVDFNNLLMWF